MNNLFDIHKYYKYLSPEESKSLFLDTNPSLKENLTRIIEEIAELDTQLRILGILSEIGDPTAKLSFKQLILRVLKKGDIQNTQHILRFDYVNHVEIQELESLLQNTKSNLWKLIFEISKKRGILNHGSSVETLRKLTERRVPTAEKILKGEIIKEINEGLEKGTNRLLHSYYIHYLNNDDVEQILNRYNIDVLEFIKEKLIELEQFDHRNVLFEFLKKVYQTRGKKLIKLMFTEIYDKRNTLTEGNFLGFRMILELSNDSYVMKKINEYLRNKQYFFEGVLFEWYCFFDILDLLLSFFTVKEVINYIKKGSTYIHGGYINEIRFIEAIFQDPKDKKFWQYEEIMEQQKRILKKILKTADYEFIRTMLIEIIYTLISSHKDSHEITQLLSQNNLNKYNLRLSRFYEDYHTYYSSDSGHESAGYYSRKVIDKEIINFIKDFI